MLSEILDSMNNITFKTTWSEAQQMLIDNPVFAEDTELLSKFTYYLYMLSRTLSADTILLHQTLIKQK